MSKEPPDEADRDKAKAPSTDPAVDRTYGQSSSGSDSEASGEEQDLVLAAERAIADQIAQRLPADRKIEADELAKIVAEIVSVEIQEIMVSRSFRGPYPPPDMLREYDLVVPGFAKQIVEQTTKEQEFRHEIVRKKLQLAENDQDITATTVRLGQWLGFVISMTSICGGIGLIATGHSAYGVTAIVGALAALVLVFVAGKAYDPANKASKDTSEESDAE